MNKACLSKLGWKLMTGDNNMWCQVVRVKYDRENNNLHIFSANPQDSSLWKNIIKLWSELKASTFWDIGNG